MNRSELMKKGRTSMSYVHGIKEFTEVASRDMLKRNDNKISCPCKFCGNVISYDNILKIEGHLVKNGFLEGYTCLTW